MAELNYHDIVSECENDLRKYGDTFQGMGWTKKDEYAELRYQIMIEMVKSRDSGKPVSLLDVGCGTARLYQHILDHRIEGINYAGLDLSTEYLAVAKQKFPGVAFFREDILKRSATIPQFDFVIMNGVLTYRGNNSEAAMWRYLKRLLTAAWQLASRGLAFNVMTKYLDWERDDLFHLSLDKVSAFISENFTRSFLIRHDYGLYEYTVYIFRTDLSDGL